MKVALIPPIPDLRRFASESSVHLLLAQLCHIDPYREYYKERSIDGDYLILDNGADEIGQGMRVETLLSIARYVGAQEVVLPDVQQDGAATYAATREACEWLITPEGREAYADAGHPRLMIVPQGRTRDEWLDCFEAMWNMHIYSGRVWNENYEPVVGLAKNHEALIDGGLVALMAELDPTIDVHLLGWPRRLEAIPDLLVQFPRIRSIDTARAFVYGRAGISVIPYDEAPTYPERSEDYFDVPILATFHDTVRSNINAFKIMAKDSDGARLRA